MLANIASIEIPKVIETLLQWMERQPPGRLARLGVDPETLSDRTFYPRIVLGEFYHDQILGLVHLAEQAGHAVSVRTRCKVVDAAKTEAGITLTVDSRSGGRFEADFDHVVLATGHQWPETPEARPGYFVSPYPATALAQVPACHVGIRGSSLSAIDAVVALATAHGEFVQEGSDLRYQAAPGTQHFKMTMISRKGLLPEADFYFPLPYEPLSHCTADAVKDRVAGGADGLLDDIYSLFKRELSSADPDYVSAIGIEDLSLEKFYAAFFAQRSGTDPFDWAERNLAEAEENYAAKYVVQWRYAILRMHEVIQFSTPHLNDRDFQRFTRYFSPVFVDDYATVPHESIRRLLALHACGKLDVMGVGEQYVIDTNNLERGATLRTSEQEILFPAFVEAIGQRALKAKDFPFPTLRDQGIIRDIVTDEADGASRGIVVDDQFHPISSDIKEGQLFCLSLPFLMGRHPFIQGLTSAHEMGTVVGEELANAMFGDPSDIALDELLGISAAA